MTSKVKLADLCELITKGTTPTTLGARFRSFGIPFLRVENITDGELLLGKDTLYIDAEADELLKRSRIKPNDVLLSIAGTIGKVTVVADGSSPMNCNQALAIIRTGKDLLPKYLYYWLRTIGAREQMRDGKVTATISNLSLSCIGDLELDWHPVGVQRRIIEQLDKADRVWRFYRYKKDQITVLLESIFLELFGDPFINPKDFPVVELSSLGELDRGRSKHRPRNAPHLFGGPYPFIQTGDVANAHGYIRDYKQTYSDEGLKQSKLWPAGTLCITIAANIGKTAILTFPACFPDSIVGFSPSGKTKIEYVQHWLMMVQEHIERTAPESAQKNINLEILDGLQIPLPPADKQEKFVEAVQLVERIRLQSNETERQAKLLFDGILEKCFADGPTELAHAR